MSFKNVPFGKPEAFNVVMEIQKNSPNKYEYYEELGIIRLDWVFKDGLVSPLNYGYVPQSRGGDGDHLDAFVLSEEPLGIGTVAECRPIGIIEMLDRGEQDDKIVGAPTADPAYANIKELSDLPFDYKKVFTKYFEGVAKQKNKVVYITGFGDSAKAQVALEQGHRNF